MDNVAFSSLECIQFFIIQELNTIGLTISSNTYMEEI
jgi:hypothetical protein